MSFVSGCSSNSWNALFRRWYVIAPWASPSTTQLGLDWSNSLNSFTTATKKNWWTNSSVQPSCKWQGKSLCKLIHNIIELQWIKKTWCKLLFMHKTDPRRSCCITARVSCQTKLNIWALIFNSNYCYILHEEQLQDSFDKVDLITFWIKEIQVCSKLCIHILHCLFTFFKEQIRQKAHFIVGGSLHSQCSAPRARDIMITSIFCSWENVIVNKMPSLKLTKLSAVHLQAFSRNLK